MSDELRLQHLFAKYLQRSCTPEEVEEMLRLLSEAGQSGGVDQQMLATWNELKTSASQHPTDWDLMYDNITHTKAPPVPHRLPVGRWRWMATAAAIFIAIGAIFFYTRLRNGPVRISPSASIVKPPIKQNGKNDRQTIHLPDGSTAILNAGSKLNYPSAFSGNRRDVYLTGEGFFDIQHNTRQPFYVHLGKISIKVLGTAFNIRSAAANDSVLITVTRGKVQVLREDKSLAVLTASQQFSFDNVTNAFNTKIVDTIPVIAWKPAEIYFNDMTLGDVALSLEKRFGVTVDFINTSAKNCRVTATFSEDDLPEEVFTVVCAVTKTDFTTNDSKIVINGKGCE